MRVGDEYFEAYVDRWDYTVRVDLWVISAIRGGKAFAIRKTDSTWVKRSSKTGDYGWAPSIDAYNRRHFPQGEAPNEWARTKAAAYTKALPEVAGYRLHSQMLNARHVGSTQNRERRVSFGTRDGRTLRIDTDVFEPAEWDFAVTGDARQRPVAMLAGGKRKDTATGGKTSSLDRGGGSLPFERMCELQGLPADFLAESPFTVSGKRQAVGNGVPLPMGRAIARAVKAAMSDKREAA